MVTTLTVPPVAALSRASGDAFDANVTSWLAWHNTQYLEYTTLTSEIQVLAADAEAAAGALANAMWISGPYTAGDIVWSPTDYFNYRAKTTGTLTTDPSADETNWALLTKTESAGSTTTSSAVDLVLTVNSTRLQVISMTASGKKVTLPAATTLEKGSPIFVFKNSGAYKFHIYDGAGSYLASVNPSQVAAFHCSDISTTAGVWAANGNDLEFVKPNTVSVLNAVAVTHLAVDMISATAAIVVWKNGTSTRLDGVVVNTAAAEGSVTELTAEATSGNNCGISVLSSTQMLLAYKGATNKPRCIVINYSGNTLTPATAIDINATTTGTTIDVKRTSDTSAVAGFTQGATLFYYAAVITIAGSTPSAGTAVNVFAATVLDPCAVVAISATKGCGLANISNGVAMGLFSITGSVVAGTGSTYTAATITTGAGQLGVCLLNSNRILIVSGTTNIYDFVIQLLDVSGTTPLLLDKWSSPASYNTYYCSLSKIDSNSALLLVASTGIAGGNTAKVRVSSDDKIYVEPMTKMYALVTLSNYYQNIVQVSSGKAVLAYRGLDTYLNVQEVEVGL